MSQQCVLSVGRPAPRRRLAELNSVCLAILPDLLGEKSPVSPEAESEKRERDPEHRGYTHLVPWQEGSSRQERFPVMINSVH